MLPQAKGNVAGEIVKVGAAGGVSVIVIFRIRTELLLIVNAGIDVTSNVEKAEVNALENGN